MPTCNPVYWNQGLLLEPQHLQQQSRYHDDCVQSAIRLTGPNVWGVRRLDIREGGLSAGVFEIACIEAVTEDGTLLVGGSEVGNEANALVRPRSLAALIESRPRDIGIFIGVARLSTTGRSVAERSELIDGQILPQRYVLASHPVSDVYEPTEQDEIDITVVQYLVQILFDIDPAFQTAAADFEVVPIARVTASDRGARLNLDYFPPALSLGVLPALLRQVKGYRDAVDRRVQDFERLKRERGIRAAVGTPQDMLRVMMLQTLSRHAVLLHQVTEQTAIHPEALYTILRMIVCELSAFSEDFTALGATSGGDGSDVLPPYDHRAIEPGMRMALDKAHLLLGRLATGPADSIELVYDGEYFKATLPPSFFEGRLPNYFLVIDSDFNKDQLTQALRNSKISDVSEMDRLRGGALYGLKIEHLTYPPEQLPQRAARYAYFEVEQRDHYWDLIKAHENIALYCPELAPERTRIMIVKTVSE
jgi:type VI secretion system protein ImpJ